MLSKWTAIQPEQKERHFMVTELVQDEADNIIGCHLQAVINKNQYEIDWIDLKDNEKWEMGWK